MADSSIADRRARRCVFMPTSASRLQFRSSLARRIPTPGRRPFRKRGKSLKIHCSANKCSKICSLSTIDNLFALRTDARSIPLLSLSLPAFRFLLRSC